SRRVRARARSHPAAEVVASCGEGHHARYQRPYRDAEGPGGVGMSERAAIAWLGSRSTREPYGGVHRTHVLCDAMTGSWLPVLATRWADHTPVVTSGAA